MQTVKKGEGDEKGGRFVTEDEKRRILESCHAGIEGKTESIFYSVRKLYTCINFVHVGSHP